MTDRSFEATESRVRAALRELGDSHQPDLEQHWPASHPNGERRPDRPPSTRRWMLVAASIVVVLAGIAAVAVVQRDGARPSTDLPPSPTPTTAPDPADDPLPTTAPTVPPNSVPGTAPAEELRGVRFPVADAEQEAQVVAWADGFLAITVDLPDEADGATTIRARFTTDGQTWDPIEVSTPTGLQNPGKILSVAERLVMTESLVTADGDVVIRVASSTDLRNWSSQDFDLPGARPLDDQTQLGAWWPRFGSFAANDTGWVFEIVRTYNEDLAAVLPSAVPADLVDDGYRIRSDATGFTVAPVGSPPTPESTYSFTWDEVGVAPETVPYLTGEIPIAQTWTATWDGTPTVGNTALEGPMLASSEGFVRWNDRTWFSADGRTWSSSPLPDPTGAVVNAFPIDGGFVAIVANERGTSDLYRLDERGGNPRQISLDELPGEFVTGFADRTLPGFNSTPSSAAVLVAGRAAQTPLVIDSDEYRYIERGGLVSIVDLATGEVVLSHTPDRPPAADTTWERGDDGMTFTDPETETVLMQIPIETYEAAHDDRLALVGLPDSAEAESDLRLLASRDGEQFLVEPLRSSDPTADVSNAVAVTTNGRAVLARLGNEWIRFDLPT